MDSALMIRLLQAKVAGQGLIYEKMNSVPGSVAPFPKPVMDELGRVAADMRSRNLTPEQVKAEILKNIENAENAENADEDDEPDFEEMLWDASTKKK